MTAQAKAAAAGQAEAIRRRLQTARDEAEASLTDLRAQVDSLRSAATASNSDDEHDPEGSTGAFEAEQLETLRKRAAERLAEVDRARQRHENGVYGICARCERPIGTARLAVLPATALCVACAGRRR